LGTGGSGKKGTTLLRDWWREIDRGASPAFEGESGVKGLRRGRRPARAAPRTDLWRVGKRDPGRVGVYAGEKIDRSQTSTLKGQGRRGGYKRGRGGMPCESLGTAIA